MSKAAIYTTNVSGATVAAGGIVPVGGTTRRYGCNIKQDGNTITVERPSEDKLHKSLHGLTRTLLHNMVEGVTHEFSKELEVNGVGYRVAKEGKNLVMKRFHARARGRASRVEKPFSEITIVVREVGEAA